MAPRWRADGAGGRVEAAVELLDDGAHAAHQLGAGLAIAPGEGPVGLAAEAHGTLEEHEDQVLGSGVADLLGGRRGVHR